MEIVLATLLLAGFVVLVVALAASTVIAIVFNGVLRSLGPTRPSIARDPDPTSPLDSVGTAELRPAAVVDHPATTAAAPFPGPVAAQVTRSRADEVYARQVALHRAYEARGAALARRKCHLCEKVRSFFERS